MRVSTNKKRKLLRMRANWVPLQSRPIWQAVVLTSNWAQCRIQNHGRHRRKPRGNPDEIRAQIEEAHKTDEQAVKDAGGLFVLATERHESRRIDNQLRGRSGRQGDPGRSHFPKP